MRVLVVGGNGFLGSHVVDALLAAQHRVRVLSPHPELFRPPNHAVEYRFGRLEVGAHIDDALEGCDAVVDCVTSAVPASADRSPASTIAGAVGAATWLGEISARLGIDTHVYLSSGGTVYGRGTGERAHRETDPLAPIGTYGALKAATELSLSALLGPSSTRLVVLRVANAYGERQNPDRPQGIVGVALARLRAGQQMTLFGDTVRDFVHASDVAAAVVRGLEPDVSGVYNIGSGEAVTVSDLLARIERIVGRTLSVERLPARDFDVPYSVVDIARAVDAGWRPAVGLDEGLQRSWDWFREVTG